MVCGHQKRKGTFFGELGVPDQSLNHLLPDTRRHGSYEGARLDDEISVHTRRDRGYGAAARRLQREALKVEVPPTLGIPEDNLVGIGSIFNTKNQQISISVSDAIANAIETSLVPYAGKREAPRWLPVNDLLRIINEEDVYRALLEACGDTEDGEASLKDYAAKVCGRVSYDGKRSSLGARSMFAILAMIDKVDEIRDFIDGGFTDENLPLVPYTKDEYPLCPEELSPGELDYWTLGITWDRKQWRTFLDYQRKMRSPFFELRQREKGLPHYDLDPNTVLPFIEDHGTLETIHGGFSMNSSSGNPSFAVKELISQHELLDKKHELDFRQEVRGWAKSAGVSDHPHLTRLLATWSRDGKWSLLFPWAKSNLNGFWEMKRTPTQSPRLVQWIAKQCLGLAEGLMRIHKSLSDPKRQWGIHGDIKPQNILWFEEPNDDQGILAISDFGFTRFHGEETRSNAIPVGISPTYRAPEYDTVNKISRAADLWALSCVYLEFVTWYLTGYDGVKEFLRRRQSDDRGEPAPIKSDKFFNFRQPAGEKSEDSVEVKRSVTMWITQLRHDPKCSLYFQEFLSLIEHKLLCVKADTRDKCDMLVLQLRDLERYILPSDAIEVGNATAPYSEISPGSPTISQKNEIEDDGSTLSTSRVLKTWASHSERGSRLCERNAHTNYDVEDIAARLANYGTMEQDQREAPACRHQNTESLSFQKDLQNVTEEAPLMDSVIQSSQGNTVEWSDIQANWQNGRTESCDNSTLSGGVDMTPSKAKSFISGRDILGRQSHETPVRDSTSPDAVFAGSRRNDTSIWTFCGLLNILGHFLRGWELQE
ncbi:protein kinase domain-containing protein [Colletotrichum incanum]|uniref:Protein kinase domain-containing protein n=1 Tax=Colletotrichum incanum TaxID=1573173 RepID=A0A167D6U3_COLIC|nr:protein kinase domain-containing protein [Colletotrichum incanum]